MPNPLQRPCPAQPRHLGRLPGIARIAALPALNSTHDRNGNQAMIAGIDKPATAGNGGGMKSWLIAALLLGMPAIVLADGQAQAQRAIHYKSGPAAQRGVQPGLQKTPYLAPPVAGATATPRASARADGAECLPFGNVTLCFAAAHNESSARTL